MAAQCTALNLSDRSHCEDEVTSLNGLFCQFHSRQCQGLYKGYKLRNARLDALNESPPSFLANSTVSIANQDFADAKTEATLRELHTYLVLKHNLLTRVIAARKTHHIHFYSESYDYGHQHYLDSLQNQKYIATRALERLERRTAEVLFDRQNWFEWVRERQREEERQRDNEKKKVKREAALFKRHAKQIDLRVKDLRIKENQKRQEEYLNEAYMERMARMAIDDEAQWDPIDDVVEDERGIYLNIINMFLVLKETELADGEANPTTANDSGADVSSSTLSTSTTLSPPRETASGVKEKEKKKQAAQESDNLPETRSQMRTRLKEGVNYAHGGGYVLRGTIENPIGLQDKTPPLPDDEIDKLLEEVTEIKHLLFSRRLLSHASLLPAAIRASSVEEFLNDSDVDSASLRDLSLELESPGLQEVRDACADLFRSDEESDDNGAEDEVTIEVSRKKPSKWDWRNQDTGPQIWRSKREKQLQKRRRQQQNMMKESSADATGVGYIDFGDNEEEETKSQKMRVKVCGRYIYNYPSEKAMNRGGWLHFCIIAKDSNLFDAIQLCRSWDEFFELNILSIFQFFPASNWLLWVGDRLRCQLLQLGFIPYSEVRNADKMTVHHQTGSRGLERRAHAVLECRNFIAAYVKRSDQASRRLIQYLSMQSHRVLLLVRDAKTGQILISPPKEELWLVREKKGIGRAVKNPWKVVKQLNAEFFKEIDTVRKWNFGFDDYYDIFVWDNVPGDQYRFLYTTVVEMLFKAHRFHNFADTFDLAAPILRTLTREEDSQRVREMRTGENVESIYDTIHDERTKFMMFDDDRKPLENMPKHLFYDEIDEIEDRVLFPEENLEHGTDIAIGESNLVHDLEKRPPDMKRFVYDLDTDEETPDSDLSEEEESESEDDLQHTCHEHGEDGNSSGRDQSLGPEDVEKMALIKTMLRNHKISSNSGQDMRMQWERYIKRSSSHFFKKIFHNADLEPGAQQRYFQSKDLVERMATFKNGAINFPSVKVLAFLEISILDHRLVAREMRQAYAMMAIFFPWTNDFFESEAGLGFKSHLIVDQVERAKHLPDRRTSTSNKCMPKQFWQDWDRIRKEKEDFPSDWDKTIRPILAHRQFSFRPLPATPVEFANAGFKIVYKEGIIRNSYYSSPAHAIASREPSRSLDLYVDYRIMIDDMHALPGMRDPPSKEHLLITARKFAHSNAGARFAFLRLWSAPHFWPLIIGIDKRYEMCFHDAHGRSWEWKFIPKDMPFSEWSVHRQASLRIEPFKRLLKDKVVVRKDTFLVMGTDEAELLKLAAAVVYAVQTDPWRLEVDLWRSFVNVDLEMLEGLDVGWLD